MSDLYSSARASSEEVAMSQTTLTVSLSRSSEYTNVASMDEAARLVRADIERRGIGSAAWHRRLGSMNGAPVVDEHGSLVAHISYNGRVWAPDGTEMGAR